MLYAYSEATVPKVTLIIRKAYGGAYLAMCSKDLGADQVFAWPTAEIAVMGPDGAANIIFKNEIANSDDPISTRKEMIEKYRNTVANPAIAAQRGFVDDILIPSHTRPRLISAFDMLETKRENRPSKKHGNLPV
jgi:acetyl-CoA carboxylase carboxyltransferase component